MIRELRRTLYFKRLKKHDSETIQITKWEKNGRTQILLDANDLSLD